MCALSCSTAHECLSETNASDSPSRRLMAQSLRLDGVIASMLGNGDEVEGYGSKYAAVYLVLKKMPPSALVVLSDGRDVLLNNPASSDKYVASR
jgi:hypothetical protein